jgi:hypothetical protein
MDNETTGLTFTFYQKTHRIFYPVTMDSLSHCSYLSVAHAGHVMVWGEFRATKLDLLIFSNINCMRLSPSWETNIPQLVKETGRLIVVLINVRQGPVYIS